MLHAPVLEIVGRHAKADFGDIYDDEWAKIDQSERPQAERMLAYFLKTKTAALLAYFERDDVSPLTKTVRILYWKMTSRSPARSKKAPADASAGVVAPPGLRKLTLQRRTWYGRYAAVLPPGIICYLRAHWAFSWGLATSMAAILAKTPATGIVSTL